MAAMKLRLIGEAPENLEDFEIIEEQSNLGKPSTLYVAGPMIGCNQKNRNGRYYDFEKTRPEVTRYIEEMVKTGRAMGELNHPASADVNLERACHLVTELSEISDGYHGKAKVLSTPCGMILRSLINDGVRIGMSTRALGSLKNESKYDLVENMHLVAVDAVADPSHSKAFVNGIVESRVWVVEQDGRFEEMYENFEKSIKTLPKKDVDQYLREQIIKFVNAI
jgi:hypothetical protein